MKLTASVLHSQETSVSRQSIEQLLDCLAIRGTLMKFNTILLFFACLCSLMHTGYEPPRRQSAGLFGLVRSSEQSLVDCRLAGEPGPSRFYWERGDDLNTTRWSNQ